MCRDPTCSFRVGTGMSGNFLSCSKGGKEAGEVQVGRRDFPRDATAEKGLISPAGENLLVSLELWQVPLELRWVPQGPAGVASGKTSLHMSCEGPLGIPVQSVLGPRYSSGTAART